MQQSSPWDRRLCCILSIDSVVIDTVWGTPTFEIIVNLEQNLILLTIQKIYTRPLQRSSPTPMLDPELQYWTYFRTIIKSFALMSGGHWGWTLSVDVWIIPPGQIKLFTVYKSFKRKIGHDPASLRACCCKVTSQDFSPVNVNFFAAILYLFSFVCLYL